MVAVADRGELELRIGGQTRTLRFRSAEVFMLEEKLESDALTFVAGQRGQTRFLVTAILCGLSRTERDGRLSPSRVGIWLDEETGLDREKLQKDILYAIARGKNGDEAKKMVAALDEAFAEVTPQEAAEGKGPLA